MTNEQSSYSVNMLKPKYRISMLVSKEILYTYMLYYMCRAKIIDIVNINEYLLSHTAYYVN